MSPHTNFHAPRTSLSGSIQIGQKSGLFIHYYLFSVNIKPPRQRFGFSLAWGWQKSCAQTINDEAGRAQHERRMSETGSMI